MSATPGAHLDPARTDPTAARRPGHLPAADERIIRYEDRRLFDVATNFGSITVQARRSTPFCIVDMLHHAERPPSPEVPGPAAPESGESGPDGAAGDDGKAQPSAPSNEEPPEAKDAPKPLTDEEEREKKLEEHRTKLDTPVKEKKGRNIFDRLDAPVLAQLVDAQRRRALLPSIGWGRWTLAAAVPRSTVPRSLLVEEPPRRATTVRERPSTGAHEGHAFFMRPRVTNNTAGAGAADNTWSDTSTDSDSESADGPAKDPSVVSFAEGLRERIPAAYVLYIFDVHVPAGPFIGDEASASCISGGLFSNFRSSFAEFDRTFSWCRLDWALLRFSARRIPPEIWALMFRHSQTMFPKTDKNNESIASVPGLMCSPNPKLRFCFDLRPKTRGAWTRYLESGYVLQGRNADGSKPGSDKPLSSAARRKWAKDVAQRREALKRVRVTVNRDFRGTLYRMREYHMVKKCGTWFDPDYIEVLSEMQETDSINATAWQNIMRHMIAAPPPTHEPPLPPAPTMRDIQASFDGGSDAETDDGWDGVDPGGFGDNRTAGSDDEDDDAGPTSNGDDSGRCKTAVDDQAETVQDVPAGGDKLPAPRAGAPTTGTAGPPDRAILAALMDLGDMRQFHNEVDAFNDEVRTRRRLNRRLARLYTVELWDAETDEPLAATFGFQVGRAFHDCSMATYVRSRAQLGHLLTHAVADLLQRAGVELWYWGAELPYMSEYRKTAGAFDLPIGRFLPLWRAIAVKAPRRHATLSSVVESLGGAAPMPPVRRRRPQPPPPAPPVVSAAVAQLTPATSGEPGAPAAELHAEHEEPPRPLTPPPMPLVVVPGAPVQAFLD